MVSGMFGMLPNLMDVRESNWAGSATSIYLEIKRNEKFTELAFFMRKLHKMNVIIARSFRVTLFIYTHPQIPF